MIDVNTWIWYGWVDLALCSMYCLICNFFYCFCFAAYYQTDFLLVSWMDRGPGHLQGHDTVRNKDFFQCCGHSQSPCSTASGVGLPLRQQVHYWLSLCGGYRLCCALCYADSPGTQVQPCFSSATKGSLKTLIDRTFRVTMSCCCCTQLRHSISIGFGLSSQRTAGSLLGLACTCTLKKFSTWDFLAEQLEILLAMKFLCAVVVFSMLCFILWLQYFCLAAAWHDSTAHLLRWRGSVREVDGYRLPVWVSPSCCSDAGNSPSILPVHQPLASHGELKMSEIGVMVEKHLGDLVVQ